MGVAITEFWGSWSAPGASPCCRPSGRFPVADERVGTGRCGQHHRLGGRGVPIIVIRSESRLGSPGSARRSSRIP